MMVLGEVLGQIWATRQIPQLDGRRVVVVRDPATSEVHAAVDLIGVSVGNRVLLTLDDAAIAALGGAPLDAAVVALVEETDLTRDLVPG